MASFNSLYELESLFIEKLQEKYKLNIRDVKKAFARFDIDNNGLLDLHELGKGILLFLNGVKESQIRELVSKYDLNGDGKISYEEFLHFLQTRSAIAPDDGSQGDPDIPDEYSSAYDGGYSPRKGGNVEYYDDSGSRGGSSQGRYQPPASPQDHRKKFNSMHAPTRPKTAPSQFNIISHAAVDHNDGNSSTSDVFVYADSKPTQNNNNNNNTRKGATTRPSSAASDLTLTSEVSRPPTVASDIYSELNPDNPKDLESRAKIYLTNLKANLYKQANDLRFSGQVKLPMMKKFSELQESVARTILMKKFQPYTGMNDGRVRERLNGVEFPDFARVLRSFTFAGTTPIRSEVVQFLFDLCSNSIIPRGTPRSDPVFLNEEGRPVADIQHFLTLIFGTSMTNQEYIRYHQHAIGNTAYTSTGAAAALDTETDPVDHAGRPIKSFVSQLNANRVSVGRGPVQMASAVDAQQQRGGLGGQELLAVPLRFVSRKSRTVLAVPSNFEPNKLIPRSNALPQYSLRRKYVFGLSTTRYSGNALHVLPTTPSCFHTGTNGNTGTNTNGIPSSRNPNFLDPVTIVYTSAALGIVHDLSSNRQVFFDQHKDDITCVAISLDGRYAATGVLGKQAVVHVWDTNVRNPDNPADALIRTIGMSEEMSGMSGGMSGNVRDGTGHAVNGVGGGGITGTKGRNGGEFQRGVCALEFAYDNKYLVAIGCDDNHTLGVFDLSTGNKVVTVTASHGIPPQIHWMKYCPSAQHTEYITREHAGLCDLFATAGDHHIRIWSFRRPPSRTTTTSTSADPVSLEYKALTLGTTTTTTVAKCYTCCAFLLCEDKTYDIVAGGNNGTLYLWRKGILITSVAVMGGNNKYRINVLVVYQDKVFIGGVYGMVKVVDGRTLSTLRSFAVSGAPPSGVRQRPGSSGGTARGGGSGSGGNSGGSGVAARSSSRGAIRRPGGGSAAVAHTAKPSARPPSHPAGQRNDRGGVRAPGENIITGPQSPAIPVTEREDDGMRMVTGMAVVPGRGRGGVQGTYLLLTLSTGKLIRLDVGNVGGMSTGNPKTAFQHGTGNGTGNSTGNSTGNGIYGNGIYGNGNGEDGTGTGKQSSDTGTPLLYFHAAPVYGLCTEVTSAARLFATVSDDKRLCLWDVQDTVLIARTCLKHTARVVSLDKTNSFLAVGSTAGTLTVYFLSDNLEPGQTYYQLLEVGYRKDCPNEITDISFSPNNALLAIGCRDDCLYVYSTTLSTTVSGNGRNQHTTGACTLKAVHKLRGHSSAITHIDWSYDSQLLRSTCQAYELLCWEVATGNLCTTTVNIADVTWKTHHCVLGFDVMGIWPCYSDGTDINAIDVHREKGLVITGNDSGGLIRLLNYPCVVKNAPAREYSGHSSHVMNVRFMQKSGEVAISVGGNDGSVVVWEVVGDVMDRDGFR